MTQSTDNTAFEHTGPGTPAGNFLRRFWHPVLVGKDLACGRAQPLRVLGEDFTLYRGENGDAHLLEARCLHRRALLSIGCIEGDAIRCRYHGWKYDPSGQCTEQPAERRSFAHKIRLRSYPVREYMGLIWAYIGEGETPPAPRWPQIEGDHPRIVISHLRKLNFFADLENVVDEAHVGFAHGTSVYHDSDASEGMPEFSAEETEYGFVQNATFCNGRVRHLMCIMPNCVYFETSASSLRGLDGLLWVVPVDDHSHRIFFCITAVGKEMDMPDPSSPAAKAYFAKLPSVEDEVQAILTGQKRFEEIGSRPDRSMIEDHIILAAQGDFPDKSAQHLGTSDVAVILLRKIWAREIAALAEGKPLKNFRIPETLRPL